MKKLHFFMIRVTYIFPAVVALMFGFGSANGQDKSTDTTARYFLTQASIGNLQEVNMSRTAVAHAQMQEVKDFAQQMITDHSKAEDQLMQLVKRRGIEIPGPATDIPPEDIMLAKIPARDFDKMYVHMMVPGHRQTVQMFEKYALTGKDPDVKAFAQQTLPILKKHLQAIIAIDQRINDAAAK
jgi:putative membrane protein